jgi:hypothetical protein
MSSFSTVDMNGFKKLPIPIPYPDNPKKSLEDFKLKLVNRWFDKYGTLIKACSPIVADVEIIIESAGNSFPPFTAFFETFCKALSSI